MKKPQPDLAESTRNTYIGTLGSSRKFKRYWDTTTVSSTEVLNLRRHYHPESLLPVNSEKLFRFLGVTKDLEEATNEGIKSAWFFLNKSKGKETFKVPSSFMRGNLNKMWWDDNDGPIPADLKLTTTISIGADYNTLDGTPLIDPASPAATQAQAVIDNYETLWANNQITQEGIGVLNKGDTFDDTLKVYVKNEDELSPDDPWVSMISMYALRDDGIPCTIKDVEVGIGDNATHLYNSVVVTLEIPYHEFDDADPIVQRMMSDNDTDVFPANTVNVVQDTTRANTFLGGAHSNEQIAQSAIKTSYIYETAEDIDVDAKGRTYLDWEDNYIGTSSYDSMWLRSGIDNQWYLKTEVFSDPKKYSMTTRRFHDYLWSLVDTGIKKKKVPWWKKLIAIIIFIVVAIITYFSMGTTSNWLAAAYALVAAAFALSLIALLLTAVGANEMAMAFMSVNKAVEPLVQIASIIIIVTGIGSAMDAANAAATEAAKQAGTEVVKQTVMEAVTNAAMAAIDAFIQGISDLASGVVSEAAIGSASKIVQAYTMTQQMKLADIQSRNNDLKAEYDRLSEEMARETDALQGFMNIYSRPATADWSMFASLFDLPYERGGGGLAMGNIQRTTKQAMRKADYAESVFENMRLV